MLDSVGISRFISKYTEYYIYGEADLYTDSLHMFVLEFNCADLIFTDEFYYALDITNERFIYARPNETTNILEYILFFCAPKFMTSQHLLRTSNSIIIFSNFFIAPGWINMSSSKTTA